MTEHEARQVLLLQARESGAPSALWSAEDRAWATRQAVATVGEDASPERFVVARAVVALQRLLPRDAAARRWLARRGWHAAWVLVALVLGFAAGLLADQLGAPQRVNLLAPAVWAVVAWNGLVYLLLVLPLPTPGLRGALARLGLGGDESATALWARHAGPLLAQRVALVLHAAAAALGAGLVAGLYLRGLVLDYRAGWQSTFLNTEQVQQGLGLLLAPARWATGIAMPDVAPLRVGPDGLAQATAAPWIHLYAATLVMAVLLPRLLLAGLAGLRARRQSRHFPLPLTTPYFETLHPLMRPGLPRAVRVLWLSSLPSVRLLGQDVGTLEAPRTLWRSDEGDELELVPVPPGVDGALATTPAPWWAPWRALATSPLQRLQDQVVAVLLVAAPGTPRPAWLGTLARPVLVLAAGAPAEPSQLALNDLADGWLPDGRLLPALAALLEGDPRLVRLAAAWQARQQAQFDARVDELAQTLARIACARQPVVEDGMRQSRQAETESARQALLAGLDVELRAHDARLATLLGLEALPEGAPSSVPAAAAALRARVGEGRAALWGGVLSGALAGLKADLLSGGLTMGAGAVAGGVIGALGAAGAARGLNAARGTERSFVVWNEEALAPVTEALLLRCLLLAHGLGPEQARDGLACALAAHHAALSALWRSRQGRFDNAGDGERLARDLRAPLAATLRAALAPQDRGR